MPPAENNEIPKLQYNLPPPVNDGGSETDAKDSEKAPSSPELSKKPKTPTTSSAKSRLADFNLGTISTPKAPVVASSTSTAGNPQIADDNDLIEKEWVSKAKKIIESTREDPYQQSEEITSFKADYMKKRYNKVIKASD